ncbi:MAG: TonB-dependent receptor [Acidobacteriota bacterium]|nr:MAG: TonB-dependent receptor [Acidobacteriota bacterium]
MLTRYGLPRVRMFAFFALILLPIGVFGQSDAGSAALEGVVRDQAGAVIRGATVVIKNRDTNLERTVTTNQNGLFSTSVLPVGRYIVTAKSTGFADAQVGVTLTVGESTPVEIQMSVEGATAVVEVTDSTDTLETESASAGTTIAPRLVADLPVRGRNFTEFVQLTPAVIQEGDRSGLVISGQRSINSNVAVDGADFNDALQGNQRGGNEAVFFFPQTAVREFQVVRSGATAEVGRTGAGFVNAVTKSGTNEISGEAFFFNRNRRLTSPDAFGQEQDNAQNQFGGSIGGPIVRNKVFYFFGIEQNFLRVPFFVKFDTIPGQVVPANILAYEGPARGTNNPTATFTRIDWALNPRHSLKVQHTYTRFRGENFNFENPRQNVAVEGNYTRKNTSNGIKSGLVSVINPNLINEFRFQVATDKRLEDPNTNIGQAVIANFGTLGGDRSRPRRFETVRTQLSDNISYDTGRNKMRFGVDINVNQVRQQRESNTQPRFDFESRTVSGNLVSTSLDNYLNGRPRRFRQTFASSDPNDLIYRGTVKEFALFFQNRFKVSSSLKINFGLRWEAQINPQPKKPNLAIPQTARIPNDVSQWQPRAGLTYDVGNRGTTVIRLSAGIFAARTPANLFQRVSTNNGLTVSEVEIAETTACRNSTVVNLANCNLRGPNAIVTYPNGLATLPTNFIVKPRVFGFDPNFRNPRSFQASATVEQRIGADLVLTVGLIRQSTWNLQRRIDRNLFPPTLQASGFPIFSTTRPNTAINQLEINESSAHSDYNALTVSLRRRFAKRYQFETNYTWARNRDDDSNERNFSRQPTLNPFNLKLEAGPSKQDVRHNLNVSGLVDLGRGFTLSGIIVTRTGFPYTAVIQDGEDYSSDLNDANDRAVVNGVVSGRNAFRQPNFFNLDVRLLKAFRLGENKQLDISAEVFNVTRNTNKGFGVDAISNFCTGTPSLANPSNPLNITCPTGLFPSVLADVPYSAPSTARFGGPRQVQLGARFRF